MGINEIRGGLPEPIETARLVLRRPIFAHVPALTELANNRKISDMLADLPHPYTSEDAISFIENRARSETGHAFAITLRAGALIGMCGLKLKDGNGPEIGYWLGEPHWGAGYASEAANALVDALFATGIVPSLVARAMAVNEASCHLLEKLGFSLVADRVEDCGRHAGVRVRSYALEAAARRAAQ
ncbi:MAG: GNAT family N-acetyltransferase [Cucumibacter sp.]